jgi:hypothetical protein
MNALHKGDNDDDDDDNNNNNNNNPSRTTALTSHFEKTNRVDYSIDVRAPNSGNVLNC